MPRRHIEEMAQQCAAVFEVRRCAIERNDERVDGSIVVGVSRCELLEQRRSAGVGLVGGKFSQRYDYRYGSSSGSAAKEVTIAEMSRR